MISMNNIKFHRLEVFNMEENKLESLVKSVYQDIKNILPIEKINEIAMQTKFIQRD